MCNREDPLYNPWTQDKISKSRLDQSALILGSICMHALSTKEWAYNVLQRGAHQPLGRAKLLCRVTFWKSQCIYRRYICMCCIVHSARVSPQTQDSSSIAIVAGARSTYTIDAHSVNSNHTALLISYWDYEHWCATTHTRTHTHTLSRIPLHVHIRIYNVYTHTQYNSICFMSRRVHLHWSIRPV